MAKYSFEAFSYASLCVGKYVCVASSRRGGNTVTAEEEQIYKSNDFFSDRVTAVDRQAYHCFKGGIL